MMPTKKRRKRKSRYHRGIYVSQKTGATCRYRSGWELLYMQYLDAATDVLLWTYEDVTIPYVSNVRTGKMRNYYPDFLVTRVDGSQSLVEIKPARRVSQLQVAKKLSAATQWCRDRSIALEVVTEAELKNLGILK